MAIPSLGLCWHPHLHHHALAYLSSVASRFGLWGKDVGWGNFENFLAYTAKLHPFLPLSLIPPVGWVNTIVETAIAVLLILDL